MRITVCYGFWLEQAVIFFEIQRGFAGDRQYRMLVLCCGSRFYSNSSFLVKPIVSVMSTPTEAVSSTVTYLTICFIGIPFIIAYNVICSIFRGMGDSKSPMYFVAIACAANIVTQELRYVYGKTRIIFNRRCCKAVSYQRKLAASL